MNEGGLVRQEFDWNKAVELKAKGYLELNNGKEALYGPIQSVTVNEADIVELRVKWAARRPLGIMGIPSGEWEPVSGEPCVATAFPNFVVPFVTESTPEKGPRIRFGLSILYIEDVSKLKPTDVKGLVLTNQI